MNAVLDGCTVWKVIASNRPRDIFASSKVCIFIPSIGMLAHEEWRAKRCNTYKYPEDHRLIPTNVAQVAGTNVGYVVVGLSIGPEKVLIMVSQYISPWCIEQRGTYTPSSNPCASCHHGVSLWSLPARFIAGQKRCWSTRKRTQSVRGVLFLAVDRRLSLFAQKDAAGLDTIRTSPYRAETISDPVPLAFEDPPTPSAAVRGVDHPRCAICPLNFSRVLRSRQRLPLNYMVPGTWSRGRSFSSMHGDGPARRGTSGQTGCVNDVDRRDGVNTVRLRKRQDTDCGSRDSAISLQGCNRPGLLYSRGIRNKRQCLVPLCQMPTYKYIDRVIQNLTIDRR
nr:hypothetical protein CFP56_60644 [Quercus suber]